MAEYISREEALNLIEHNDRVCHYADERYENVVYATAQTICKVVAEMPAADVQPVDSKPVKIVEGDFEVQGYLVKEKYYCCPNCELTFGNLKIDNLLTLVHENKFCKECGQKLDWDSIMSETIKG